MNILVIGAGSVGSLFGGLLSRKSRVVLLGSRGVAGGPRAGFTIADEEGAREIRVTALAEGLPAGEEFDLIAVATKATANRKVALSLRSHLGDDTHLLLLQNGMGNEEVFGRVVRRDRILRGVVYHGVYREGPERVLWWGKGLTYLGYPFYPSQSLEDPFLVEAAETFEASGLKTRIVADIRREVWKKLIINAAMNPLGALTGSENLALVENRDTREILARLVDEGQRAARLDGYAFDLLGKVEDLARRTGRNMNSMLQDFRRRRRTEIEFLNGYLVRFAEAHNEDLPYHRCMAALVRALEARFE